MICERLFLHIFPFYLFPHASLWVYASLRLLSFIFYPVMRRIGPYIYFGICWLRLQIDRP